MLSRSLYKLTESRVCILNIKSSLLLVHVGLPLAPEVSVVHGQDLKVSLWKGRGLVWEPQGHSFPFLQMRLCWHSQAVIFIVPWSGPQLSVKHLLFHTWVNESQLVFLIARKMWIASSGLGVSLPFIGRSSGTLVSCSGEMAGWTRRWIDRLESHVNFLWAEHKEN